MTCQMRISTVINSSQFTIAIENDTSILGLAFQYNLFIQFLPTNISNAFPELEIFGAGYCNLSSVSRVNFAGLIKLKALGLHNNYIERIESYTFEDLTSLEYLYLRIKLIQFKISFLLIVIFHGFRQQPNQIPRRSSFQ